MLKLSKGEGIRNREDIQWCTYEGKPSGSATQKPLSFIADITSGTTKASAEDLIFRDPDYFVAGEIHEHYNVWEQLLEGYHKREEILRYISEGVSVFEFFKPFKGQFKGKQYDPARPPRMCFENNKICSNFKDFISSTILERVANGSLSIWGKEGECPPPNLVMPITIEPSKPRMCHDERFLNLWMNTPHVSFDKITYIPRYVEFNHL